MQEHPTFERLLLWSKEVHFVNLPLFALEDTIGLTIGEIDGEICLRLDKHHKDYTQMFQSFNAWLKQKKMLQAGETGQDDYDHWKYHFPEKDAGGIRVKVPAADFLNPDFLKKE